MENNTDKKQDMSPKLAAIYGRVSTTNQENEGTIETQLLSVRDYAKENDFMIVKEYIDEGWSGDILARPGLDQLRVDAKNNRWDAVLIYDPDRLARKYSYQELVMEQLRDMDIDVLFVTVPEAKNDEDRMMYGVRGLFAQYEKVKIADRFRLGKVRKARSGHIIASEAPYGYTYIPRKGSPGDDNFKQGYYRISKIEAPILKDIFNWVADEGLTLRGVVRRLQERSIKPRKSKRGVWSTSTLSTMLRNRTYIGEGRFGSSYAVVPDNPRALGYKKIKKSSRRIKPESEWIIIKTPRLVSDDVFDRAVSRLRSNFEKSIRNTKNEYLLTGQIACVCGKKRCGEGPQKGKHLYYRCTDRVKSFPLPPTCKEKALNARETDSVVWDKVVEIMTSPDLLKKQIKRWESGVGMKTSSSSINIKETEKEISKLNKEVARYVKVFGVGEINMRQLKEVSDPVKKRIADLENQIAKARELDSVEIERTVPSIKDIEKFCEKAKDALLNLNFTAKKAIIRDIIDRVVGTREELQVYGYIPITNINVITINRNRRSAKRGKEHAL